MKATTLFLSLAGLLALQPACGKTDKGKAKKKVDAEACAAKRIAAAEAWRAFVPLARKESNFAGFAGKDFELKADAFKKVYLKKDPENKIPVGPETLKARKTEIKLMTAVSVTFKELANTLSESVGAARMAAAAATEPPAKSLKALESAGAMLGRLRKVWEKQIHTQVVMQRNAYKTIIRSSEQTVEMWRKSNEKDRLAKTQKELEGYRRKMRNLEKEARKRSKPVLALADKAQAATNAAIKVCRP